MGCDSESNGSLMRVTPLSVFTSKITDNKILEKVVDADVSFTHCKLIVLLAVSSYCIAIRELINGKSRKYAYKIAK